MVDSPILDNQVIGNSYFGHQKIGKPDMINPYWTNRRY